MHRASHQGSRELGPGSGLGVMEWGTEVLAMEVLVLGSEVLVMVWVLAAELNDQAQARHPSFGRQYPNRLLVL